LSESSSDDKNIPKITLPLLMQDKKCTFPYLNNSPKHSPPDNSPPDICTLPVCMLASWASQQLGS